jgi:hypothetical protein
LAIIIGAPICLKYFIDNLKDISFVFPQTLLSFLLILISVWKRTETVYDQLQPVISSFWKVKNDFESKIDDSISQFEQKEKAIRLTIERNKTEISLLDEQIQKSSVIKAELDFKINNALATEALYSFIDKRTKSDDYKKHLGIISIIRKDFEVLNNLFTDHNREAGNVDPNSEFRKKFTKPLERIILYVDDLDRCPEENVVQVLEAVNLLMAFALFIVVVGVDARWVKNALIKKNSTQFVGNQKEEEIMFERIEPSNYLEKIFQIPFHLKEASNGSVKTMIKQVAQTYPEVIKKELQNTVTSISDNQTTGDSNKSELIASGDKNEGGSLDTLSNNDVEKDHVLIFTDEEINIMQDLSDIIGNNPRAIKRFVNIFRIIKSHEEFNGLTNKDELLVILFLIALPLGKYKTLIKQFEAYIQDEANLQNRLNNYFDIEKNLLKNQLNITLSEKNSYKQLQSTRVDVFSKYNIFVRRFSFESI